jgi:hypothetical protein
MEDDLSLDWDQANIEHIRGHGVTPDEVLQVFANEASDLRYEVVNGEERRTHQRLADSGGRMDYARRVRADRNRFRCG